MGTEQLKELWFLAFGDSSAIIDSFFATAYAPERCRFLEENGQVTAALYWLDGECAGEKFAYIYAVGTHPAHRGQGLCRKLMALTHKDLKESGYAGALLMPAGEDLRQMYAKMGYRECSRISETACAAGETGIPVRTVTVPEYAALRRKYLPRGGLLQEGENLAYLCTYASLYAGDGFVMAAVHEADGLFVPELLGDPEAAPGILRAMGYERGTFRTPGNGFPFAMYCPLKENAPVPAYLGLAFD